MASTLNKTVLLLKQPERKVGEALTLLLLEDANIIVVILYYMYEWQNSCFSIEGKRYNTNAIFS